jgi:hypothetical protein
MSYTINNVNKCTIRKSLNQKYSEQLHHPHYDKISEISCEDKKDTIITIIEYVPQENDELTGISKLCEFDRLPLTIHDLKKQIKNPIFANPYEQVTKKVLVSIKNIQTLIEKSLKETNSLDMKENPVNSQLDYCDAV